MQSNLAHALLNGAFVGVLALAASGCGKSLVTDAGVSSSIQNGDQIAEVYVIIDTNGVALPSVRLPIFNPLSPGGTTYGQLSLDTTADGKGEVKVDLDLTTIAQLPGGTAQLPNGTAVPVSGVDQTKVLAIPVPTTRFVIYVALHVDVLHPGAAPIAMVGVALPFTQFDPIGQAVGDTDLFMAFNLPKGIQGTAGVFAGRGSGRSGIGIFIDVSGLIQQASPQPQGLSIARFFSLGSFAESPRAVVLSAPSTPVTLRYGDRSPGGSRERAIKRRLGRMSRDRVQLTID